MPDIIIIGGITRDVNIVEKSRWIGFGGGITYISYVLANLGINIGLVSHLDTKYFDDYVETFGKFKDKICFKGIKRVKDAIIKFENKYINDHRIQYAYSSMYKIGVNDLPHEYLRSKIAVITPVLNEISTNIINFLKSKGLTIIVDIQGFVRKLGKSNIVIHKRMPRLPYNNIDMVKGSLEEVLLLANDKKLTRDHLKNIAVKGPSVLVITYGHRGSYIYLDNKKDLLYYFSAIPVSVKDATGAGDVYLAGLVYTLYKFNDIVLGGKFASAMSAISVKFRGPIFPISKSIINKLIKKVICKQVDEIASL